MITYISFFAYEKKYEPKRLTNFQYSTYKQTDPADLGDSLTYSETIGQCPPGQCAINKKSGIKRCPQNINNKLTYNTSQEACTRINTCDYSELPYAVNSDGSANGNLCENGPDGTKIACRCTNNIQCNSNVLSKFKIIAGSINGENQNYTASSFFLGQEPLENQEEIGRNNIVIEDPANEFCQINPGFTNVISPGCNFQNSVQDKLSCSNIPTTTEIETGNKPLDWEVANQNNSHGLYKPVGKNKNVEIGQTYLILRRDFSVGPNQNIALPPSGFISLNLSSGSVSTKREVIFYGEQTRTEEVNGVDGEAGQKFIYIVLYGITNINSSTSALSGTSGFVLSWQSYEQSEAPPNNLILVTIDLDYCTIDNSETNYKNMLLCTQNDNNICPFGNFTYNFDKLTNVKNSTLSKTDETFSRNFCQLNPGKNIDVSRTNYIEDPTYYTMSCSIGSGCDGKIWEILENGENPDSSQINLEAISRYFPEVDVDAINGIWDIKLDSYPTLKNLQTGQLISEDNIKPGDYWSIKSVNQILIASEGTSAGVSIIQVQDLYGLENFVNQGTIDSDIAPGLVISGTSYTLTSASFTYNNTTDENLSFVNFTPNLADDISVFSSISVYPKGLNTLQTSGMISLINNQLQLTDLNGQEINTKLGGDELDITIYKQFSFSGGNYGTKIIYNSTDTFNRRLYLDGSGNPISYENSSKETVYPYPPQNIYLLNIISLNSLNTPTNPYAAPEMPFKMPLSMYYPVWNPVLYRQECIRCKPLLITYPQIGVFNNIVSVIIQFSGKDFGNYQKNKRDGGYCYVSTSEIQFDTPDSSTITSQRIVLKEPNYDVMVGDYVLDSTLKMPLDIVVEGNPTSSSNLQIVPRIFPSSSTVTQSKQSFIDTGNTLDISNINFSYGLESSDNENFIYQDEIKIANQKINLVNGNSSTQWKIDTGVSGSNNYFFGKKYTDLSEYCSEMQTGNLNVLNNGFYFVPTQKVVSISSDRTVVEIDTSVPYQISQNENESSYVQFCRMDNNLNINILQPNGDPYPEDGTEIVIGDISDSRITYIGVSTSSTNFLSTNPPLLNLALDNQNFL